MRITDEVVEARRQKRRLDCDTRTLENDGRLEAPPKKKKSSRMRPKGVFSLECDTRALENDGRLEAPTSVKKKSSGSSKLN